MMLGFDPAECLGVSIPDRPVIQATAPVSKVVSIPPSPGLGFRSRRLLGFNPTESWGVDPDGFRVSIPMGLGFRTRLGFRSLGFEPD